MKKLIILLLTAAMALGCLTGCGGETETNETMQETSGEASKTEAEETESASTAEEGTGESSLEITDESSEIMEEEIVPDTQFVLEYPADMQALGFTESLVLEKAPERIVCLSTAPVLALHELGANIIGVPVSTIVVWPEELLNNAESVSFSVMSDGDFDFESVLALEPDLVFLASAAKDTAGAALESLGLTVYYVYAGHTVSYESVKMQTEALINAFDMTEESILAGREIMARFDELEARLEETKATYEGKTVLVLQSNSATSHYAQTSKGTLGSMLDMMGFTNVYENEGSSLAQIDLEQALFYNPDYIVCVGAGSADAQKALMEDAFESNPDYWYSMAAVENGNVIYMDVTYISSAGINVIDRISDLIDIIETTIGE